MKSELEILILVFNWLYIFLPEIMAVVIWRIAWKSYKKKKEIWKKICCFNRYLLRCFFGTMVNNRNKFIYNWGIVNI